MTFVFQTPGSVAVSHQHAPLDLRCIAVVCWSLTSSFDGRMRDRDLDLLQGTLDLLVLKTLTWGPAHGYAIVRWIQRLTGDRLTVGEGSLYPALHRLEERGLVKAEWRLSENNRRARFYSLT